MKSYHTYMMVAAMAVAGIGMSVRAADDVSNTPGAQIQNTGTQLQTTGGQIADDAVGKEARHALARIVNDGVTTDKFASFTSYLAKADRERLGNVKSTNVDDLNNAIKQFRQDFKDKYNQEFDISADQLSNAMVYAGTDKNSATVSLSKPVMASTPGDTTGATNTPGAINTTPNNAAYTPKTDEATADRTLNTTGNDVTVSNRSGDNSGAGLTSRTAGNRTGPASNGSNSNSTVHGNDVTATPGVAHLDNDTVAANTANTIATANSVGMSSLTLNLVNEGHIMNAWRISDPQISAEQLKQNLTKHIQMMDDQKAAWPSDVNAAYQKVAYHVLSAFSDTTVASER